MPPQPVQISVEHHSPDLVRITMGPKTLDLSATSARDFGLTIQTHAAALLALPAGQRMEALVNTTTPPASGGTRGRAAELLVELLNLVKSEGAEHAPAQPTAKPPTADLPTIDRGPTGWPPPEAGQGQPNK